MSVRPLSASSSPLHTPPPGRFCGTHACVVGASIAGLLAARVLSAHFDRVTIFDRDTLPLDCEQRLGVPQGRHGHGLLASGFRGLSALFPTMEADLVRRGALSGDVIGSMRWFQHGRYKARFTSGLRGLLLSRPLLETTVRRHVLQIPNVRVLDRTRVLGLLGGDGRVTGVRAQGAGEEAKSWSADLVIDASGRASRSPVWLPELGYQAPAQEEIAVGVAYTTRVFVREPHHLDGDVGAIIGTEPPADGRIGTMLAMENDRWIVSLMGRNGNHAPIDHAGFLEFARSLPRPDVYDVIRDAEPVGETAYYPFPSNLRRRYERLERFPGGYLVLGDAISSFNPIYGQGMSVATLEALALEECLERTPRSTELWKPFFKAAGRIVDGPWTIAVGGDFEYEGVTGERPAGVDLVNRYMRQVHLAAATDRTVCRAFFDAANLLAPPSSLMRPAIAARVAKARLFDRPQGGDREARTPKPNVPVRTPKLQARS